MGKCPTCGLCEQVYIYKRTCRMWYRPNRSGYTVLLHQAGLYWRCEAQALLRCCDELEIDTESSALERPLLDDTAREANREIVRIKRETFEKLVKGEHYGRSSGC